MNHLIDGFIRRNSLEPGDTVIVDRSLFDSLDPFVVYMGQGKFLLRKESGIQIIPPGQVVYWLQYYPPKRLSRYQGKKQNRRELLDKILNKGSEKAYFQLLSQTEAYSGQKKRGGSEWAWGALGLGALLLLGAALLSKNNDDD